MTLEKRLGRPLMAVLCALLLSTAAPALAQGADGQDTSGNGTMGKEPGTRLQERCEPLRTDAGPLDAALTAVEAGAA